MRKIPTIFDRDWDGDKTVTPELVAGFYFPGAVPTEKLDGMNVRLTIRNGGVVRIEKRSVPGVSLGGQGRRRQVINPSVNRTAQYGRRHGRIPK